MPVVTVYYDRIFSMLKGEISKDELIDKIPYLGLDIEEQTEEYIKIEYNPNRPDYSTDYGLARSLNSFLDFETQYSKYDVYESDLVINIDKSTRDVRPYIVAAVIKDIKLEDETIRQIITMQEDLHNGIGRKRKKVAIGIHNLDVIESPLEYITVDDSFSFIPLNKDSDMTIKEILDSEIGNQYASILAGKNLYPIIRDANKQVLSFPPIINGDLTRLDSKTTNLFIDVTGTDLDSVCNALSVIFTTLNDAGGKVHTVEINSDNSKIKTPQIKEEVMEVELEYVRSLLGLELSEKEIITYLRRCRISANIENNKVIVKTEPFRFDLIHPVDVIEEIVLGYGIHNLKPTLPGSDMTGGFDKNQQFLDKARDVLTGLGLIEIMTIGLISEDMLKKSEMSTDNLLKVVDTKSIEHKVLKNSNVPSILKTFSKNIHKKYPQRIFEISRVFNKIDNEIQEHYQLTVGLAHATVNFTEASSYLNAFGKQLLDIDLSTKASENEIFVKGRAAEIIDEGGIKIGVIGEIKPQVLENFALRTPISLFDIDLDQLMKKRI
ncbi:MAG: phenylalanine--tRNA ligase subunit beta [Thaumarchaeota archaeon]|nr:phenylalanine--tRNA ligase subunit beta [Nitrososphaerota archaeon]